MIRKFLDLSTAHLTPATRDLIWSGWPCAPITTWLSDPPHDPASCFVHVPDDLDDPDEHPENIPDDLMTCLRFARSLDCDRILFDRDGPTTDALPVHEDEAADT